MVNPKEIFLLDTNTFITPFESCYAIDLVPSYWKTLAEKISDDRMFLLDKASDEILPYEGELSSWIRSKKFPILSSKELDIIRNYQKVQQYVNDCGLYTDAGIRKWADTEVADPWLIAAAMAKGYSIVSYEKPNLNISLSKKNKVKDVKIPDVAAHFGVKCVSLFGMMRALGFEI